MRPDVGQGDATLNVIGLKNAKFFNSENPRSWDFFLLCQELIPRFVHQNTYFETSDSKNIILRKL